MIISADGNEIISGSGDKTLRRWSSVTGECIRVYKGHNYSVTCVAFLQNGQVVSGSSDQSIKIWDTLTGECLQTLNERIDWMTGIVVCCNGDLVSVSYNNLQVWRAGTTSKYVCIQTIEHSDRILSIALSSHGGADDLITNCYDNITLYHREIDTGEYKKFQNF